MAEAAEASRFGRVAGSAGRGIVRRMPQLALAVGGGLLLCVSFPPFGWWYAAIAALAIFGGLLHHPATTWRGGLGFGFVFGLAFYLPLLPWISGLVGSFPWLALSVVQALFCGLFGLSAVVVRSIPGWPLWFAALWSTMEWVKSTVPFGGFPWGVVAFGQADGPFLPLAHLGGAPLLSFAVALTGFCLATIVVEIVRWLRAGDASSSRAARPAVVLPGVCISVVLLTTALVWPQVRHSAVAAMVGTGEDRSVAVALVQGNVPRLGLDFNAQRRAVLDNHVRETLRLAEDVRAGRAQQPVFVVWPENSSDIDPLANPDAAEQISVAAAAIDAPILVGGVVRAPGYTRENPEATNSVIVWDPVEGAGERHDKRIVQPFGEYLPWRGFFSKLSPYAERAGYFVPGRGTGVVDVAGVPVGIATCWEVIFDRAARAAVRNGAEVLVVPTNNATFDEPMSEQQLAFGKVRAVEHNRYVLVAGTTGISAVITPDGHEQARTGFFEPAYLDAEIGLKSELTPATRWGPIVQGLLIAAGVGALIAAMLQQWGARGGRPRRRRRAVHTGDPAKAP